MSKLNRRDFLTVTASAAAASALATPSVFADDKIRVGMLGTQHVHVPKKIKALHASPHYELTSICEPDAKVRAEKENDPLFAGLKWVSREELLADKSIRMVVVECKFWEAIPFGKSVIEAGKHLHLEKPPGAEMEPFADLIAEAKKRGLLLQMGYLWRFHDGINAAFEAARKGWLGDVYQIRGTIDKDLPDARRKNWAKNAGGTFFWLGSHLVDRIVDFWGRPTSIKSFFRNDTQKDGLADNTLSVLEYPQGMAILGSVAVMAGSLEHRSFEVIGTDGSFMIQPIEPGTLVRVVMREARGPYKKGWQDIHMPKQPRYVKDLEALAQAIKKGEPLAHSYEHELLVQETVIRACEATA